MWSTSPKSVWRVHEDSAGGSVSAVAATSMRARVETRSEVPDLLRAVSGLPAECQRVLALRKIYGWEYDRIADHLGIERYEVEHDLRLCAQIMARNR